MLVIGVVALFAAIVGGGIKIREIEVGSVPSRWRQWVLAAFGIVVAIIGLILVVPNDTPTSAAETENVTAIDENGADANRADAIDPNTVAEKMPMLMPSGTMQPTIAPRRRPSHSSRAQQAHGSAHLASVSSAVGVMRQNS